MNADCAALSVRSVSSVWLHSRKRSLPKRSRHCSIERSVRTECASKLAWST